MEGLEYQNKLDKSILNSSLYRSIILDGAYQSTSGLLNFCTTPKIQRQHALEVKMNGFVEQYMHNKRQLYTMMKGYATGANVSSRRLVSL